MANINIALKKVFQVEFNDNPDLFLHRNSGEHGWTLGGVYQKANPYSIDWNLVNWIVDKVGIKRASRMLYFDTETMNQVLEVYNNDYWLKMKLDKVESQKIADEIFIMGVVSGVKTASKIAQRTVNVIDDGIIGNNTLAALNAFNEDVFDKEYDRLEIEHFEMLAENNHKFNKFLDGWRNRAVAV